MRLLDEFEQLHQWVVTEDTNITWAHEGYGGRASFQQGTILRVRDGKLHWLVNHKERQLPFLVELTDEQLGLCHRVIDDVKTELMYQQNKRIEAKLDRIMKFHAIELQ